MKKKILIITALLVVGLIVGFIFLKNKPTSNANISKETGAASNLNVRDKLLTSILSNQIVFYGKVVDENDNPVPFAEVKYSELNNSNFDKVWTGGGKYEYLKADANGCFSISGEGGSLYVACSHSDYYLTETSGNKFNYGMNAGKDPAVDPKNPAIFRLRKKGVREPLIYWTEGRARNGQSWLEVPNGGVLAIDTVSGRKRSGENSIYISYWNNRPSDEICQEIKKRGEEIPDYDWGYVLKIPGGGFIEKKKMFDFIAPTDGYSEEIRFGESKDAERWKRDITKYYFVRFPNNTYGIFEITGRAPGDIYYNMLLNPAVGSRNLEYDGEKQINSISDGFYFPR